MMIWEGGGYDDYLLMKLIILIISVFTSLPKVHEVMPKLPA